MADEFDLEAYVNQASAAIGLAIQPEQRPGVMVYMRLIADNALLVNEFLLDGVTEIAPVFTPCCSHTPE